MSDIDWSPFEAAVSDVEERNRELKNLYVSRRLAECCFELNIVQSIVRAKLAADVRTHRRQTIALALLTLVLAGLFAWTVRPP
jgi:hypothetical protein